MFQKELMLIRQCIKRMWYLSLLIFLDKGFKYEPYLCSGCHDLMQTAKTLMMLLLFLLKEAITEFIFGILAKVLL